MKKASRKRRGAPARIPIPDRETTWAAIARHAPVAYLETDLFGKSECCGAAIEVECLNGVPMFRVDDGRRVYSARCFCGRSLSVWLPAAGEVAARA